MQRSSIIPGYNGLRAIACLAVFAVHLQQLTLSTGKPSIRGRTGPIDWGRLAENGNTGVCLFFMLSGFLLSLPFWHAPAISGIDRATRGSRWLFGFALRRIARILPAYYLCLTALILMGKAAGTNDIILHYLLLHNFTEATLYSINDPFWTIAVQAQFYIVFAFLMLPLAPLARHKGIIALLLMVCIVATFLIHSYIITSASTGALNSRVSQSVLRVSMLAHLPHFLLGMLAALAFAAMNKPAASERFSADDAKQPSIGFDFFVLLCAVAILAILAVPSLDELFRLPVRSSESRMVGRYNFPYVPLLIAIILVLLPRTKLLVGLMELAPIRFLGVISYGIYVFHLPCLELCKKLLTGNRQNAQVNTITLALLGLGASIIVASISFFAVERPLMRWSKRGA